MGTSYNFKWPVMADPIYYDLSGFDFKKGNEVKKRESAGNGGYHGEHQGLHPNSLPTPNESALVLAMADHECLYRLKQRDFDQCYLLAQQGGEVEEIIRYAYTLLKRRRFQPVQKQRAS